MSEGDVAVTRTKLSESLKSLIKDRRKHRFVVERCQKMLSSSPSSSLLFSKNDSEIIGIYEHLNKTSIKCILKAAFRYHADRESSKVYFSLLHFIPHDDVEKRSFIISTALRYLQRNLKDSTKGRVTDNARVCPRVDLMRLIGKNVLRKEIKTTAQVIAETMLALFRSRRYDLALKMFDKHQVNADVFCYNLAIESAAQCGLSSRVPELCQDMRERQVEPNRHTYFKLLSAAHSLEMQGDADILIEMLENRTDMARVVREHKRTREIILNTIKRCGPSAATRIVELIGDDSSTLLFDEKIAGELLLNLIRYGSTTRALSTFEDLWERGVIPEMHVLVRLVDALGRTTQHLGDALRMFRLCTDRDKFLFRGEIESKDSKLFVGLGEFPCGFVKTALMSSMLKYRDDINKVVMVSPSKCSECAEFEACSSITKFLSQSNILSGDLVVNSCCDDDKDDRELLSFDVSRDGISEASFVEKRSADFFF